MTLPAGTRLGPYEILTPLGAGVFHAAGGRPEIGVPQPLFPMQLGTSGIEASRRSYDVGPDGARFIVIRSTLRRAMKWSS